MSLPGVLYMCVRLEEEMENVLEVVVSIAEEAKLYPAQYRQGFLKGTTVAGWPFPRCSRCSQRTISLWPHATLTMSGQGLVVSAYVVGTLAPKPFQITRR